LEQPLCLAVVSNWRLGFAQKIDLLPHRRPRHGVSWMLGLGRLGSILGSSIGGVLLSQGWGFDGIFMALAAPAVLAALAILLNRRSL